MRLDRTVFAQCRTCFTVMCGILSVKAREDCLHCGGEALNVNNHEPSDPIELAVKYPRRNAAKLGTHYRRI